MKYLINKPNLSNLEKEYVLKALKSTWLSANGKNTKIFEKKISKILKNKYFSQMELILHLALKSLGLKLIDKVIVCCQCGATSILVDIEKILLI